MPRQPRLDLPGIPQHVVQRGVDRRPCFVLESHYREYLARLSELVERFDCKLHAYVLMCNHVHLLATPAERGGVGRLMQALGRHYVGYFNAAMGRTGTLWEGRFKSCLVDSDLYVLRCYRYIELNPVRAGITSDPVHFPWSSFRCNGLGGTDPVISPHVAYLSLAPCPTQRLDAYRRFVAEGCASTEIDEIRAMTSRQRAFGGAVFKDALERTHERPMGLVKFGRPRLKAEDKLGS